MTEKFALKLEASLLRNLMVSEQAPTKLFRLTVDGRLSLNQLRRFTTWRLRNGVYDDIASEQAIAVIFRAVSHPKFIYTEMGADMPPWFARLEQLDER